LVRHLRQSCQKSENIDQNSNMEIASISDHNLIQYLKEKTKKMSLLEQQIAELKDKPSVQNIQNIQNLLQVICVSSNDNHFDILTERFGNSNQALEYIKGCAWSDITGDSRLIENIYLSRGDLDQDQVSICVLDKAKTKIEYLNEKKEKVESNQSFSKKMANNLQNIYLKGINYSIDWTLNDSLHLNKFLEECDFQ
jgi:hypothetical protein